MTVQKGFTLIELLVTIAIAGIVATVGIPSFTQSIRSSRLTTNINELVTAVNLARSEAVKRNQSVSIIRTGANWEDGWDVITDADEDGTVDVGTDEILRTYGARPGGFTLRATSNIAGRLTYRSSGLSDKAGSFVLCDNSDANNVPEANTSRLAIVNIVGRVRMGTDGDNDGIPEKSDGEITSCTVSPFN